MAPEVTDILKLLVVEDDPRVCEAMRMSLTLARRDWEVVEAANGASGLKMFLENEPDVVVLDINMPEMDGLELLSKIRECSSTPVIMLTGRKGELDIVQALEMGANDYVSKPFSLLELMARIRVQARRVQDELSARPGGDSFVADGLTIHFPTRSVTVEGQRISLTKTEYQLLYQLVQNAGRVVPQRTLLRLAWGSEDYASAALRLYISRLRSKLAPNGDRRRYILTKPGVGYLFRAPDPSSELKDADP
jgi:two-component system KDP operon response regulator KdpE